MASSDFTQVLLADPAAPLVTVTLEEASIAAAGPLVRLPYLESLLDLLRQGASFPSLAAGAGPAVARAHGDLATYLAELIVPLFDAEQLKGLQGTLAPYQGLADPATVRRAFLAQMSYVADVATSMPRDVYSASGGVFRLAWRRGRTQALACCLRTGFIFLPQPVAACIRSPPATGALPTLARVALPDAEPTPCAFVHGKSRLERKLPQPPPNSGSSGCGPGSPGSGWRF